MNDTPDLLVIRHGASALKRVRGVFKSIISLNELDDTAEYLVGKLYKVRLAAASRDLRLKELTVSLMYVEGL